MLLPIVVTAVFLSTTAIAQQPPVVAPKPSGHYLSKPSATNEDFREIWPDAKCERRSQHHWGQLQTSKQTWRPLSANGELLLPACVPMVGYGPPRQPLLTPRRLRPRTRLRRSAHLKSKSPPAAAAPRFKPPPERYYAETPEASALTKVLNARRFDNSTNDPAWRASLADVCTDIVRVYWCKCPAIRPSKITGLTASGTTFLRRVSSQGSVFLSGCTIVQSARTG